jgi:hypothetical protein
MESFGAAFPKIYSDPGFKGWWVSIILLSKFVTLCIVVRVC